MKILLPVAVTVSAPVITSVIAVPLSSVPVTVNVIPESSPADYIVTFLGQSIVTDPPEANAPPIVKLAAPLILAAVLMPSVSAAAASIKLDVTSLPEPLSAITYPLYYAIVAMGEASASAFQVELVASSATQVKVTLELTTVELTSVNVSPATSLAGLAAVPPIRERAP